MRPQRSLLALLVARGAAALAVGDRPTLRLVTFNIHAWRDSNHLDNLDRIVAQLEALAPDVVCLNEVLHPFSAPAADDPYWQAVRERRGTGYEPPAGSVPTDEAASYLMRLSKALALPHVAYGPASVTGFFGRYHFGNAVLSRHALSGVRHERLELQPGDLTLGGQARTDADLEPRSATLARVTLPCGRALGVCATHLDHKSEELRARQVREVAAAARRAFDGGCAHVLCGDLNTFDRAHMGDGAWAAACAYYASRGWPPPPERSLVCAALAEAGYVDSFREWPGGEGATPPLTCWSHQPLYRLDYLFLSSPGALAVRDHRATAG